MWLCCFTYSMLWLSCVDWSWEWRWSDNPSYVGPCNNRRSARPAGGDDRRHCVCTEETAETEHLLHQSTQHQPLWCYQHLLLWQDRNFDRGRPGHVGRGACTGTKVRQRRLWSATRADLLLCSSVTHWAPAHLLWQVLRRGTIWRCTYEHRRHLRRH